jgi:mannose-6-phosphate isomerase-like protein (cupin superfamily)
MPKYVFTEDEWMTWADGYSTHTLKAVDGSSYQYVKGRAMNGPLPGAGDYDRLLGVNTFGPGGEYQAHEHQTPMYYYVIKGRGIMRVGDEERVVGRGAWIYTPVGLKHYTKNTGDEDFAYILFGGNPLRDDEGIHERFPE